jgi:L-rhamnonate dehydratase
MSSSTTEGTAEGTRIKEIRTHSLRLPHVEAIADGTQDVLVVEIVAEDGVAGVGEVHTSPSVAEAVVHAPLSHARASGLGRLLVGEDHTRIGSLWRKMHDHSAVYGRSGIVMHTISGIDIALWDLLGKRAGQPLYNLLGGREQDGAKCYASVLMPNDPEAAAAMAADLAGKGYNAIKFGWGALGGEPGKDVALVRAIRQAAPHITIMLDYGGEADRSYFDSVAESFAVLDVYLIEEPLPADQTRGFKTVGGRVASKIATGEKLSTIDEFSRLINIGQPDIIQPDIARAGGLTGVLKIAAIAESEGIAVMPHCWSSDILVRATAHYVLSNALCPYLEYCLTKTPLRWGVTKNPLRPEEGLITSVGGPGLGADIDHDFMSEFCISEKVAS